MPAHLGTSLLIRKQSSTYGDCQPRHSNKNRVKSQLLQCAWTLVTCQEHRPFPRLEFKVLRDQLAHHLAMHVGQPEIAACQAIREPFVIEPEQM